MGCKKLLFNNIGGSVTPPPPGGSPIMDGLVGWYDAIDNKGINNTFWNSRVGTNHINITKGMADLKFDKRLFVNESKETPAMENILASSVNTFDTTNGFTIMFSFNRFIGYSWVAFLLLNGIGFKVYNSSDYFRLDNVTQDIGLNLFNHATNLDDTITKCMYISIGKDSTGHLGWITETGVEKIGNITTMTPSLSPSKLFLVNNNKIKMILNSVFVYDRLLTLEEIKHNFQYDLSIDRSKEIPKEYVEVAVDGTTTGNLIEPFMIVNLKDSIEDKTYGFCKCTFSGTSVAAMYFKDDLGVEKAFNIQLTGVSASKTYYLEFYGETGVLKLRVREDSEEGKIIKVARDTYTDIKQINITKIARISTLQCRGC